MTNKQSCPKDEKAIVQAMHYYLNSRYGKPKKCENPHCELRSESFDWCLKTGHKYSYNKKDYLRLCRSCHRKYDLTPEKREKAIKNLWWFKRVDNPGKGAKKGHWHDREKLRTKIKQYAEDTKLGN